MRGGTRKGYFWCDQFAFLWHHIYFAGIPVGIGLGLFGGAFTSSPALVSALQFSPENEVIFGYGVAYPFGLLGVILFISIAMRILRRRLEEETRSYTSMVAKLYRVINDKYHGQLIKESSDIQDFNLTFLLAILKFLFQQTST